VSSLPPRPKRIAFPRLLGSQGPFPFPFALVAIAFRGGGTVPHSILRTISGVLHAFLNLPSDLRPPLKQISNVSKVRFQRVGDPVQFFFFSPHKGALSAFQLFSCLIPPSRPFNSKASTPLNHFPLSPHHISPPLLISFFQCS